MPANYRTPDVYVEEVSTLPPSIAEVSTAIPAFLGYTEAIESNGVNLHNVPTRVSNLLEYTAIFGGPHKAKFSVTTDGGIIKPIVADEMNGLHKLYYLLDHYFKNGGSDCYIVAIGTYMNNDNLNQKKKEDFAAGLRALESEDEPTLIILSEATSLDPVDYYELCQLALDQCNALKDRFCILDVLASDTDASNFRQGVVNNLKYGAAYYPYLNTSLTYYYREEDIAISRSGMSSTNTSGSNTVSNNIVYNSAAAGLKITYTGKKDESPKFKVDVANTGNKINFSVADKLLTISIASKDGKTPANVAEAWSKWSGEKGNFNVEAIDGKTDIIAAVAETTLEAPPPTQQTTDTSSQNAKGESLAGISKKETALYNSVKQELNKFRVVLPPSAAVAGIYCSVDRERGVWKAPANISISAVIGPTVKITSAQQERFNIDADSGKSINAIRSFVGKGTMVWGARTLAGNDNEWRYIPVRRLFNMVEESAKKASYFAVFEPNTATTWLKVKGMIDSFLYGLWQQGALAGSEPKSAYYVNVGLGTTMTQQDILEGRMIIEIGLAAVRPAEFIVLKFSHKLQEA